MSDKLERARREIRALCQSGHKWTMRIPAHETDSDVVLTDALNAMEQEIAELRSQLIAAQSERDEAIAAEREAIIQIVIDKKNKKLDILQAIRARAGRVGE